MLIVPSTVRSDVVFRDPAGAAFDPAGVAFRLRAPDGTLQAWTYPDRIARSATGAFRIDVLVDQAGAWTWRWEGTGTTLATAEGQIFAAAPLF